MSLETEDDEKLLSQYDDVEWIDDVAQYQCTRCQKVLVQHYISNCEHKFCSNCKRILDDGSHRWRCPNCQQFIEDMGRQDLKFKDKVGCLRLHCPHRKYGCEHTCSFEDLKEHLKGCKHTKESALPVLYEGKITSEMLERMFTMQMQELRKEMKREMKELEERCRNKDGDDDQKGVIENAWDLSVAVDQLKRETTQIVDREKEKKWKLRVKLSQVNDRVDGVKSDLHVEATRLGNEIKELQTKQPIKSDSSESIALAVEENKAKILKLEGKTDTWMEIMDFKDRKNNDLKHELRNEFKDEIKTHNISVENKMELLEQTMKEITTAQEKNWAEIDGRVSGVIHSLNEEAEKREVEIESLSKDLLNQVDMNKTEVEKEKENIIEVNRKIRLINEKNTKMTQHVEFIKQKVEKLAIKAEGNAKQLNLPLNSSTEQKVLHLESLFLQQNAQMNMFNLAEGKSGSRPNFDFRVMGLRYGLQHFPYEQESKWFEWAEYPVQARVKVSMTSRNCVNLALNLTPGRNNGKPMDMAIIPTIYYALKYQVSGWPFTRIYAARSYEFPTKFSYLLAFESQIIFYHDFISATGYTNDALDVDVYVEPPNMAHAVYSYDGTLNWAVDNYCKRKQLANRDLVRRKEMTRNDFVDYHESPYFYTGPKGYRVQVRMRYVLGLKAEIRFLPGEFDAHLPAAFPHQTTITLFNRKNPQHNITKTVKRDIQANKYYSMDVCNNNEIENMVENDHVFYRVTITPSQN